MKSALWANVLLLSPKNGGNTFLNSIFLGSFIFFSKSSFFSNSSFFEKNLYFLLKSFFKFEKLNSSLKNLIFFFQNLYFLLSFFFQSSYKLLFRTIKKSLGEDRKKIEMMKEFLNFYSSAMLRDINNLLKMVCTRESKSPFYILNCQTLVKKIKMP